MIQEHVLMRWNDVCKFHGHGDLEVEVVAINKFEAPRTDLALKYSELRNLIINPDEQAQRLKDSKRYSRR